MKNRVKKPENGLARVPGHELHNDGGKKTHQNDDEGDSRPATHDSRRYLNGWLVAPVLVRKWKRRPRAVATARTRFSFNGLLAVQTKRHIQQSELIQRRKPFLFSVVIHLEGSAQSVVIPGMKSAECWTRDEGSATARLSHHPETCFTNQEGGPNGSPS